MAWFLEKGVWPTAILLHQCDNKLCTTVDHLNEGTHKQNAKEAADRGLKVHKYGLDHHNGKIPDSALPSIRRRRSDGTTLRELATEYGVSQALISQICRGRARNRKISAL